MILHGVRINAADYPQANARAANANTSWSPEDLALTLTATSV